MSDIGEMWTVVSSVQQTGGFCVGARLSRCPLPGLVVSLPPEERDQQHTTPSPPPQPREGKGSEGKEQIDNAAQQEDELQQSEGASAEIRIIRTRDVTPTRLGLPLGRWEAHGLAARCQQAPFGRREATVYDRSVRNTLQLEPYGFRLDNEYEWCQWLRGDVVPMVKDGLGLAPATPVECQLYKLLLYEKGTSSVVFEDYIMFSDTLQFR